MTSLISKKDIYKNNQNNKYSVVVAHPDDEILWASSICQNASQVIICFSEDEKSPEISKGRKIFQKNAPKMHFDLEFYIVIPQIHGRMIYLKEFLFNM